MGWDEMSNVIAPQGSLWLRHRALCRQSRVLSRARDVNSGHVPRLALPPYISSHFRCFIRTAHLLLHSPTPAAAVLAVSLTKKGSTAAHNILHILRNPSLKVAPSTDFDNGQTDIQKLPTLCYLFTVRFKFRQYCNLDTKVSSPESTCVQFIKVFSWFWSRAKFLARSFYWPIFT